MDFFYLLIAPVDYKIWSIVQQRVYESRVHNIDKLKQRLVHVWHGMVDQTIIDSAIDEWHGRLRACVQAKGCLLYTSPSPRDRQKSRMPSSA